MVIKRSRLLLNLFDRRTSHANVMFTYRPKASSIVTTPHLHREQRIFIFKPLNVAVALLHLTLNQVSLRTRQQRLEHSKRNEPSRRRERN